MTRCGIEDPIRRGWVAGLVTFPSLVFLSVGAPLWAVSPAVESHSTRHSLARIGLGMTALGVVGVVATLGGIWLRWGAPVEERSPSGPCFKCLPGSFVSGIYWGAFPTPLLGLISMIVGSSMATSSNDPVKQVLGGALISAGATGFFVGGLLLLLARSERRARREGSYPVLRGGTTYRSITGGGSSLTVGSTTTVPYSGFRE